jgi:hypothetical protein
VFGPVAIVAGMAAMAGGAILARQRVDAAPKRKAGVLYMPRALARSLDFPDESDPRDGVVYAGHPTFPSVYFPVSNVNMYLFKERVLEYVRLLRDLGAEEIEIDAVDHDSATTLDAALRLPLTGAVQGLPVPVGNIDMAVGVRRQAQGTASYFWRGPASPVADFDARRYPWLAADPLLQDLVDTRLAGQVHETRIALRGHDEYGVNASVAADLLEAGYKLGGDVRHTSATELALRVHFPANDSR